MEKYNEVKSRQYDIVLYCDCTDEKMKKNLKNRNRSEEQKVDLSYFQENKEFYEYYINDIYPLTLI